MATRFVTPDTLEQALALAEAGLLWRNSSQTIPRDINRWRSMHPDDDDLYEDIRYCFSANDDMSSAWHRDDFAYLAED